MTRRLAVVLVHGIGVHDKHWADATIAKLGDRLGRRVRALAPAVPVPPADALAEFRGFEWDDLFYERQMILQGVLSARTKTVTLPGIVQGFFSPLTLVTRAVSDWVKKKARPLQTKVISQFVADILAYLDPSAASLVHKRLDETLRGFAHDPKIKTPLTFISHSLGTVINSNFVYDRTKGGRAFDPHLELENLFMAGSPLALFSLRYGDDPEAFSKPVRVEASGGRWINLFDDDDPVAMPLRGLNDAYRKAVHADVQVDAGLYGLSHVGYFEDGAVLDLIAWKLAIDWLRHNAVLAPERLAGLQAEFDRKLGISVP